MVEGSPKTHLHLIANKCPNIAGKPPKITSIKSSVVFLSIRGGNRLVNDLKLSNGLEWSRTHRRREVKVIVRKQNIDGVMK